MVNYIITDKVLEVTYINGTELVAHMRCIVNQAHMQLEIIDLFATEDYRDSDFEDMLLEEAFGYAYERNLRSIAVIIGPENYNPRAYWDDDSYIKFYKRYGFKQVHGTFANNRMECRIRP